jgi:hypothetical protein
MTLDLPYLEPYRVEIDGAIAVQESFRSLWTFAGMDQYGNTLWMSPDQNHMLRFDPGGEINR